MLFLGSFMIFVLVGWRVSCYVEFDGMLIVESLKGDLHLESVVLMLWFGLSCSCSTVGSVLFTKH